MKRFILSFVLLIATPAWAVDYPARVVGISDGDTMTVLKAGKTQVKVRLHGIDAPETGQDYGSRAKQAASELAFGKDVTIRVKDIDRYGRTVAEVILPDGKSLGREMVSQGNAWWYSKFAPKDRDLAALEAEARQAKCGLWGQEKPVPPWDWRHGKGVLVTEEVIGNRNSHIYHVPHCLSVARMKEANKVAFKTVAAAEAAGYRKGGDFGRAEGYADIPGGEWQSQGIDLPGDGFAGGVRPGEAAAERCRVAVAAIAPFVSCGGDHRPLDARGAARRCSIFGRACGATDNRAL